MEIDIFRKVREAVTARRAAEFYGYSPNRAGFIRCPFHTGDQTPSLKLYADGGWFCFGCSKGGSSIDFVCLLFGLTPLEAVRKLDADFHLGLPLAAPATPQERRKAQREADRREVVATVWATWERWKDETIRDLCECARLANTTEKYMSDPSGLSNLAAECLRKRDWVEYMADLLASGDLDEQIAIWKNRAEVKTWIGRILNQN